MADARLDITSLILGDHEYFRRQFAALDDADGPDELSAIWEPLATRLDTHAQAEETVFYPALLNKGGEDAAHEADDAVRDHNKIKDAVADARRLEVGSPQWYEAVGRARSENTEHLGEEEDEALPDFRKHASWELRTRLGQLWIEFYARHPDGSGIRTGDLDPDRYLDEHS
jgi:Hemerythrin HHE cation binding domain